MNKNELKSNLSQFTGTSQYYKYLPPYLLTDGVQYLAETAQCYWLLDIIWSVHGLPELANQDFLVVTLKVNECSGIVTIDDGNNNILYTQHIEFTDFPLDEISIWIEPLDEVRRVMLLPSEH